MSYRVIFVTQKLLICLQIMNLSIFYGCFRDIMKLIVSITKMLVPINITNFISTSQLEKPIFQFNYFYVHVDFFFRVVHNARLLADPLFIYFFFIRLHIKICMCLIYLSKYFYIL